MPSIRYLVPLVAAAGYVAAQSSCSVSATTTLQNGGDATALASCRTFTGSIALATDLAGSFALDGIQHIKGSLIGNNVTQLTSLSADSLTYIDDTFGLASMIRLTGLTMPRLIQVNNLDWTALPALQGLTFTTGIQMAQTVSITNTQLGALTGINLQTVDQFTLANNRFLNDVSMQLGNVTDQLSISANGRNVVAEFPNLIWARNMTINNVSSLSIPSLQTVNGSFGLNFNYFSNISAPNLTTIGGSLAFVSNGKLTGLDFPELTEVGGGLLIANNSALQSIDGFGALQTVGGALDCSGVFNDIKFPKLGDVRGAFNVQSTQDVSKQCATFKSEAGSDNVIKGDFTCTSTSAPQSADGTSTTSGSGSSTTSHGAANAVVITSATGLLGVVAAIFGLL